MEGYSRSSAGGGVYRPMSSHQAASRTDYDDAFPAYVAARRQFTGPSPRFTQTHPNIILDNWTGLMWVQQSSAIYPESAAGAVTGVSKAAWANATAYSLNNVVNYSGAAYICKLAHTSAVSVDEPGTAGGATKWLITPWISGAWSTGQYVLYPAVQAFSDAITLVEGMSYGGFSDWRMPTLTEFLSVWKMGSDATGTGLAGLWANNNATLGDNGPGFKGQNLQNGVLTSTGAPDIETGVLRWKPGGAAGKYWPGCDSVLIASGTGIVVPVRGPVF